MHADIVFTVEKLGSAACFAKRQRISPDEAPRDLLGLMLTGRDPVTGEQLDVPNIRNQLVTFMIAGHETTSGLLSFATHLLLANPDVLEKARAEVDQVLGAEAPRFEHMSKLVYIDQVLRESLRVWPTAPAFSRISYSRVANIRLASRQCRWTTTPWAISTKNCPRT